MEVFIEKFCRRYNLSETDVKALTEQMQEVRFRKKEAIVIEGERNSNLYLIKEGIWRGHYLKDGTDTTIWFASVGEIAFSIWGYADNIGDDMPDKNNPGAAAIGNFFKISDAVNIDGTSANLTHIDFIKVQTGVNVKAGWLGENSTEVFKFCDENNNNDK